MQGGALCWIAPFSGAKADEIKGGIKARAGDQSETVVRAWGSDPPVDEGLEMVKGMRSAYLIAMNSVGRNGGGVIEAAGLPL